MYKNLVVYYPVGYDFTESLGVLAFRSIGKVNGLLAFQYFGVNVTEGKQKLKLVIFNAINYYMMPILSIF